MVLADIEVHAMRAAIGLPSGDLYADAHEAYDSRARELAIHSAAHWGGVGSRALLVLKDILDCTRLRVVRGQLHTSYIRPKIDMPEGKKLSPGLYAASTAHEAAWMEKAQDMGVGINPAPLAVAAFRRHSDGREANRLDVAEVEAWWTVLANGGIDWDAALSQASSDAVRLALVDRSSPKRVGLQM